MKRNNPEDHAKLLSDVSQWNETNLPIIIRNLLLCNICERQIHGTPQTHIRDTQVKYVGRELDRKQVRGNALDCIVAGHILTFKLAPWLLRIN